MAAFPPIAARPEPVSRFSVDPSGTLTWQYLSTPQPISYPSHVHSEFNVVACLEGSVEVRQCGEVCLIDAGEALIGNAFVPHESIYRTANQRCRAVCLTLESSLFQSVVEDLHGQGTEPDFGLVLLGKANSRRIRGFADRIAAEFEPETQPSTDRLKLLARQLLVEVIHEWRSGAIHRQSLESRAPCLSRWQFVRAHEWMLATGRADFTVRDLARKLGFSTSRFHHLFRTAAGASPAQYFANLTFDAALDKLRNTDQQIKQIAYDMGFQTPSHFCAAFRKRFGVSPLQFRQSVTPEPAL